MKKLILYLFVLTLFAISINAEVYQVNTTMTVYSDIKNNSLFIGLNNASTLTTVTDLNDSIIISNQTMVLQNTTGIPKWASNFTMNATGDYYRRTDYFSNGVRTAQSSETFRIVNNINSIAQDTNNLVQAIFQTFIIFLVPFLLAVLAQYLEMEYLFVFSGTWFIASSADLAFTGTVSTVTWSFFALLGVLLIYHGISIMLEKNELNKKKKEENNEFESWT